VLKAETMLVWTKAYEKAYHKKYDHDRYQRMRNAQVEALGGKCVVCGTTENLEVHDIVPVLSRSRTRAKAFFTTVGKELRCKEHHKHTEGWRNRRKRKTVIPLD
jgi:hypothetical protein